APRWRRILRDRTQDQNRHAAERLSARRGEQCLERSTGWRHRWHRGDQAMKGRGASWNPQNRFEKLAYVRDDEAELDENAPRTLYLRDPIRTVIAHNDSPDVGFSSSVNPYRGCEHGCIYCFARPTHEYLGFSAGLDFETKIVVKEDAPELLREELMAS